MLYYISLFRLGLFFFVVVSPGLYFEEHLQNNLVLFVLRGMLNIDVELKESVGCFAAECLCVLAE